MLTPITAVVSERRVESDGVISLSLALPRGRSLPSWQPGAHIDVMLDNGLVRQYSLSSNPADTSQWRIGVLREPRSRGGSEHIYAAVHAGDRLHVSEPRNNFQLEPATHYLFIAGGIGITPILPMVRQAQVAGADWTLLYGGRTRGSMAFLDELGGYGDHVVVAPQDEVGLLDIVGAVNAASAAQVYVCGPEPLLQAVEAAMVSRPSDLHTERFAPRGTNVGAGNDELFEVELAESGVTLDVPVGRSILSVAEEFGVPVFSSCEEGTCGTCIVPVVSGRVEHRDSLLGEAERHDNQYMLICVSRAAPGCTRLTLRL